MSAPTIAGLLAEARAALASAGIEEPGREAALLVGHVLGRSRLEMLRDAAEPVAEPEAVRRAVRRRCAREPFAFITGTRGFRDLDLLVGPATLIPRPDSETLIEAMLGHRPAAGERAPLLLDLGTGTGCLLLAALADTPAARGVGIDRSEAACALARRNAARNDLAGRAAFLCGNWTEAIAGRFDVVLCNPPYIPSADLSGLEPEVAAHEPASALDGGADGLECYRAVLDALPRLLRPDGIAVLELGQHQHETVPALARDAGLVVRELRADLGGVPRALVLDRGLAAGFGSAG